LRLCIVFASRSSYRRLPGSPQPWRIRGPSGRDAPGVEFALHLRKCIVGQRIRSRFAGSTGACNVSTGPPIAPAIRDAVRTCGGHIGLIFDGSATQARSMTRRKSSSITSPGANTTILHNCRPAQATVGQQHLLSKGTRHNLFLRSFCAAAEATTSVDTPARSHQSA